MIDGYIRIEMSVDTYKKHQEIFEAAANLICKLKQIYKLNNGHDEISIPALEEFSHVPSYTLLESMGFGTDFSDRVAKIMSATLLGGILRLYQRTKNTMKYVHKNLKYRCLVSIPAYENQEFSKSCKRQRLE